MRRTIDRLQAARREDRGFTLIELLIVIIILGILAAVVVFSVRGHLGQRRGGGVQDRDPHG